ncbi:helix-turn-helix domain-containing protein [Kitasatospora arboriphila]
MDTTVPPNTDPTPAPSALTDPTDYLTVPQVAFALRLSQETVWRMARSGHLTSYRVGNGRGQVRISRDAFRAYLAATGLPAACPPSPPQPPPAAASGPPGPKRAADGRDHRPHGTRSARTARRAPVRPGAGCSSCCSAKPPKVVPRSGSSFRSERAPKYKKQPLFFPK